MENEHPGIREASKICGVCGDRALGYNFNALSCESCKAFFRRNALKNKDFRCPFTENCDITPITRRFCQKCRLDKCYKIGMKKEYIMSEEDKILKRQKIEQNRAKKRPAVSNSNEVQKVKKDENESLLEENSSNCDENFSSPSPMSIHSISANVATPVAESYFWEADKKYIDLDAPKQNGHHQYFSTVTNFSNPSSPTDNNYYYNNQTSSIRSSSFNDQKSSASSSQMDLDTNSSLSPLTPNSEHSQRSMSPTTYQIITRRINQDPSVVAKLANNPYVISKILEDENLLKKFFTNPEVMHRITSDPKISEILEENVQNSLMSENIMGEKINDSVKDIEIEKFNSSDKHPILTNLISSNHCLLDLTKKTSGDLIVKTENTDLMTDDMTKDVLKDVQRISINDSSIDWILCEAIKLEFSAFSSLTAKQTNSRQLNDAELAKLNELIVANKALLTPLDDDVSTLISDTKFKSAESDPKLLDVINFTSIAIRRLIKMSKKISAFKNMCQEDQLALLKGGCTEMMILRTALNYDTDKHLWTLPQSQNTLPTIRGDILKEVEGNLYEQHAKFLENFDSRWKDENVILILSAIILFTPERPKVVHTDVIKLEQNSYYYLLRRYLESMYPGCEAKSMFLKLIQKINDLHQLNDEVVSVYLNVNPSRVEPLLIEIFDLKH